MASSAGLILVDTKYEFGRAPDGQVVLIDEVHTPDSSRFWDIDRYKLGQSQPSLDKQPVRDWLERCGWNKEPPAPLLPSDVISNTSKIYKEAYERLTGEKLSFQ